MYITKDDKTYLIIEYADKWTAQTTTGKLTVTYNIPKELCADVIKLRDYIADKL